MITQDRPVDFFRPKLETHFESDFLMRLSGYQVFLSGRYLRILIAYRVKKQKSEVLSFLGHCVGYLRVRFGYRSAFRLHASIWYEGLKAAPFVETDGSAYYPGKERDIDNRLRIINDLLSQSNERFHLTDEAGLFIEESIAAKNGGMRFFFMWKALESQIGNGARREIFCLSRLKSPPLNDCMKKLADLRGKFVHGTSGDIDWKYTELAFQFCRLAAPPIQFNMELACPILESWAIDNL